MRPTYPPAIESWWLDRAAAHFVNIAPSALPRRLEAAAGRMSDAFTIARDLGAPPCYDDAVDLLAYGLFFFPQTFTRTAWAASEALDHLTISPFTSSGEDAQAPAPLQILDIGCGSGAASFALATTLRARSTEASRPIVFTGVDRSSANLETARALAQTRARDFPDIEWNWVRRDVVGDGFSWDRSPFDQRWDVILLGFSFNEIAIGLDDEQAVAALADAASRLAPGGLLLLIEPAQQAFAERVERVRNHFAADSRYQIVAPCLHSFACPALARGQFWCHEVRRWTPPPSLAAINTNLHRDIRFLKFSFLALQRKWETPPVPRRSPAVADEAAQVLAPPAFDAHSSGHQAFRMVSPIAKKSGQLVCKGCAASGHINTYEWLTRHLDKATIRADLHLERGDRVTLPSLTPLATPHRFRVNP